ncbi:SWR1-complex protein 4 [Cordyceps fumosorosea ARSEF 2679]|uniref:SWR1-complex protein 4 n=1 Tax=Cordyceps fumosorosea (strain ARSEF 2679) TaxID=1081104 RepID=A0A167TLP4_CORFA|nr:SWR1-complex protein 4 [Cordyceps fumosorosea ARSEF 2679]OAA60727.1 SWR1-complex protein 4 [Cordyceps fumosorosea ARSEF 2679]
MSSTDVRDVLNLPDGMAGSRPAKKQKLSAARPNLKGLAREVHNLGGDNPIAIVPEVTQFKKRRLANRKPAARWELRGFRNSARDDASLVLRHWRRKDAKQDPDANTPAAMEDQGAASATEIPADGVEDSAFAKYNVRVSVPQYTDDQYTQHLQNEEWTREETDYLIELARDLDLRWPIIWDRYEWNPPATNGEADVDGDESKAVVHTARARALEDLKARYYEVAAKIMAVNKPVQYMTQPEFALHELMTHYNPQHEKARREFAVNSLSRSREEAREEESLLMEIKRILARSEKFNEERRELYNRLDYPRAETDISTFKSSAGLQTLLQNLMNVDKSKKRKSIMGGEGVSPAQGTPQAAAQESSTAKKEAGAAAAAAANNNNNNNNNNNRESSGPVSTPTAAGKKTPQQPHERRKLSDQEEAIYGVSHHDRLGSGPTFRTEKINKLFSHKSNQQQMRINNALNELDVPSKLAMPTTATTQQFEALLAAVNGLLDARKVSDKLDAEIKIEEAKKAEREKALAGPNEAAAGEPATATEGDAAAKTQEKAEGNAAASASAPDATKADEAAPTIEEPETGAAAAATKAEDAAPAAPAGDKAAATETPSEKEKPYRLASAGPAAHKRSASVLSATSDKSAKRQKK